MLTINDLYRLNKQHGEVGIEIEMEGNRLRVETNGWGLHADGSLRPSPESIEYVLNNPISRKDVSKYLQDLQLALNKNNSVLSPSDRCGVHIHINCQSLTINQTINYIITYLILEELLVKWCGEDREGNLFALRACDAEAIIPMLINSNLNQNFNTFSTEHRYSSVNIASLMKFGSLEFRSLRTPEDFSIIDTWTKMLLKIKDYAVAYSLPKNIVEEVSASGFSKFPKNVLGDLAELIMCKGAAGMVIEGVRRVQDIAYADLIYKKKESQNQKPNQTAPNPNPEIGRFFGFPPDDNGPRTRGQMAEVFGVNLVNPLPPRRREVLLQAEEVLNRYSIATDENLRETLAIEYTRLLNQRT